MLLHFRLNDEIDIDGNIYTVNAAFDVVLRVIDLLQDDKVFPAHKPSVALKMLIDDELKEYTFDERLTIMKEILSGYVQFDEEVQLDRLGNPVPSASQEGRSGAQYSYTEDADYIYAAFMQAYGIDLIDQQGKLHWAKFKALLNGLPNDTMFSNVLQIRGWNPSQDKEKYAQRMQRLQRQFRLKGEGEENG